MYNGQFRFNAALKNSHNCWKITGIYKYINLFFLLINISACSMLCIKIVLFHFTFLFTFKLKLHFIAFLKIEYIYVYIFFSIDECKQGSVQTFPTGISFCEIESDFSYIFLVIYICEFEIIGNRYFALTHRLFDWRDCQTSNLIQYSQVAV